MTRRTPRSVLALLVLALATAGLLVAGGAGPAGAATSRGSSPVWLPVHSAFGLDCAGHNPGCTADRSFFSIDVVPSGQFGPHGKPSHARVFAMGGGNVHIGNAHGTRCGHGSSFGTWIYIKHPDGLYSRYGHLSEILVHAGQYVAAGAPIGVVGTTGKSGNCGVRYVDFELSRDHRFHHSVSIATLRACTTSGVRQTWPAQARTTKAVGNPHRVHFTRWSKVRHGTQFPASSGRCIR